MNTEYQLNRCWQWVIAGLVESIALTIFQSKTIAQSHIVPDKTLGTESTEVITNFRDLPIEVINGGAIRGINLFHSFQDFNISVGREAYFFIPNANIQNILARVTGNNRSEILGTLGIFGALQPNLYLMNPNGIIFGRNAKLDLGGSFVATTANAIQFPGGAEFSTTSAVAPENKLLSVNPTAFLFNQIANQSTNSIENRGTLQVPNNKTLILLGGNVAPTPDASGQILMDSGRVFALGGRVEIGGLTAPGSVELQVNGDNLSLAFPDGVARTDISLSNNSAIFTLGAGSGDIIVNADNLSLVNSSAFFAGILADQGSPETKAGDIVVNATGIVTLAKDSIIGNSAIGIGDSGNINIVGQSLQLINGSSIQSRATQGNSGIINIKVDDKVSLSGRGSVLTDGTLSTSGIVSNVFPRDFSFSSLQQNLLGTPTRGRSGGINIEAKNLVLADDAFISATSFLADDSGNIKIQATNSIILDSASIFSTTNGRGNAGNLFINANYLSLSNLSQISTSTYGIGKAGDISIIAPNISIDYSFISASAFSFPGIIGNVGNAGNIDIETQRISLTNSGNITSSSNEPEQGETIGSGGSINIKATELIEIDTKGAREIITGLVARTLSSNRAGDITLNTKKLIVRDGGSIRVEAANNLGGNAGNITINASDSVELVSSNANFRSFIATGVESAKENIIAIGNGGDLTINTKNLQLTNGAIAAPTLGKGNAGNINIFSHDQVTIDNGVINSRVGAGAVGNAGDINIQTRQLTLINGGNIDTLISQSNGVFPAGQGKGGRIFINATDAVTISGANADGLTSAILTETQAGAFGQGGDIIINTDYLLVSDNGTISTITENDSNAGNITVNARIFEALNGGFLVTGSLSSGKAGDITISAIDKITIFSNTDLNGVTGLFAGTSSSGDGGNISLFTTDFNLLANNSNLPVPATVSTRSQGQGIAGNINIVAKGNYNANNGLVSARAEQVGGGNIEITAKNINLRNNSDIRTDLSSGNRKGGNIVLTADIIVALEDSDILAFAPEGQGGDITFNTRAVFSDSLYNPRQTAADKNSLQSLINNGRSDINASGSISGNIIGVPDISFIQNSLTELQNNPIDTNALIANSCIARSSKQEGTFIISGTGGLPTRPGEAGTSSYPTGDVQNVTNDSAASTWKKGDRIVEPQGVYRLANGNLVMSRECS
ncbi:filamentous hemagglutinin N-terminal domain-containing protein [Nostoc sp. MS1]|uniref:two-partner secretion domain-containing protein n=1 Tax=Nostoc sp. MS1 TaxID=2764711 RepID=UPI001CC6E833|nr:filamentous hemagglutinin N-terminal domain-containing protein [Nostoc sp. MS1]BCL39519.1 hypothetical protein NSMS1_59660 [Nostoc sp. MS1]